jgi:hypothetical protein
MEVASASESLFAQRRALERSATLPPGWKGAAWAERVEDGLGVGADDWTRKASRLEGAGVALAPAPASMRCAATPTAAPSSRGRGELGAGGPVTPPSVHTGSGNVDRGPRGGAAAAGRRHGKA